MSQNVADEIPSRIQCVLYLPRIKDYIKNNITNDYLMAIKYKPRIIFTSVLFCKNIALSVKSQTRCIFSVIINARIALAWLHMLSTCVIDILYDVLEWY